MGDCIPWLSFCFCCATQKAACPWTAHLPLCARTFEAWTLQILSLKAPITSPEWISELRDQPIRSACICHTRDDSSTINTSEFQVHLESRTNWVSYTHNEGTVSAISQWRDIICGRVLLVLAIFRALRKNRAARISLRKDLRIQTGEAAARLTIFH